MPKKTINYGRSVVDRRVRFLSPSAIEKADTTSHNGGGCLRAFHYAKVLHFKSDKPESEGQIIGNQCHDEIDTYLTTGQNTLGRVAGAAKQWMPEPRSIGVHVEIPLGGVKEDLSEALLEIEGVPIVMYLDVVDRRGCYLGEDGEFERDPLNTIEYLDWKFGRTKVGSQKCYAKRSFQLPHDTQMVLGGLALVHQFNAEHVRLSHVYTNFEGTPRSTKATIRVEPDQLEKRVDLISGVVRQMKHVALESDPERVDGNKHACEAFGGCPWMDNCSVWKQGGGLESYYGTSDLERLTGDQQMSMGILDGINLPGMPVAATPSGVTATLPLVPQPNAHDVMAQISAVANAQAFVPAQPTQEFAQAVGIINSKGYGFVALAGKAAQMFGVLNNYQVTTADYTVPGFGTLGATGKTVDDPMLIVGMAREIAAVPQNPKGIETRPQPQPQQAAPMQLGILAPTAPASNPALAADPVPGFTPVVSQVTPNVQIPGLVASVQPAAAAAVLTANATPAAATDGIPPEKGKRKYTRRAKADGAAGAATPEHVHGDDSRWLFVNAHPNIDTEDLYPWVQNLCDQLAQHHKLLVPDLRSATGEHPLAFAKWKGHLAAFARASAAKLDPGGYFLRVNGSEIAECALEGLRASGAFELIVIGD